MVCISGVAREIAHLLVLLCLLMFVIIWRMQGRYVFMQNCHVLSDF